MTFAELETRLKSQKIPLAICLPEDPETVSAAREASDLGYVDCLFVGREGPMRDALAKAAPGFAPRLVPVASEEEAAARTVALVRAGEAKAIMKGAVSTPVLLKAILNKETGIRQGNLLSHVLVYEWEGGLRLLTDGGLNPHPTVEEKLGILTNAVEFARRLGIATPRAAILSAAETVSFKMPSTMDAAVIAKMGERKQIPGCLVDGPLALDNAISLESAHHKGLANDVVGRADILVAPDIDTGNILGKSIMYFGKVPAGGVILGASVPVVMLSRSDDRQTRRHSIVLALTGRE